MSETISTLHSMVEECEPNICEIFGSLYPALKRLVEKDFLVTYEEMQDYFNMSKIACNTWRIWKSWRRNYMKR